MEHPSKQCFKCGQIKPLLDFYAHSEMTDGRLNKCKECNKRDVAENYRKRKPQYQAYEQKRFKDPERKKKIKDCIAKRRAVDPLKYKARYTTTNAIRDGRLTRLPCEKCGNAKSQAHHDDYSRPFNVHWLCFVCHRIEHGQDMT